MTKAQEALAHVTAVFEHQQTKVERLQEAAGRGHHARGEARIQARLDKALAKKQHTKKDEEGAGCSALAKAQARLDRLRGRPPGRVGLNERRTPWYAISNPRVASACSMCNCEFAHRRRSGT